MNPINRQKDEGYGGKLVKNKNAGLKTVCVYVHQLWRHFVEQHTHITHDA